MSLLTVNPYNAAQTPVGLDRADGIAGRPGTATPVGSVFIQENNASQTRDSLVLQEYADSPTFERAEQATITHRFHGGISDILTRISFLSRGTIWTDSFNNVWKLLSSEMKVNGNTCDLTTVAESVSFDPPWDEFSATPVELGINILKHPRYFLALEGSTANERSCNQSVIRRLQDYFDNVSAPYRDALISELKKSMSAAYGGTGGLGSPGAWLTALPTTYPPTITGITGVTPGTDLAKAAALEIVQKYWRNEETPYIVGWQIEWSRYYWRPQYLHPGGIIEDPWTQASPQVPDYFWLTEAGGLLFDWVSYYNPQCFSNTGFAGGGTSISWLRKADQYDFQRTWFKWKRTWYGTAVGYWDPQFFSSGYRPQVPTDYQYADGFIPT